MQQIDVLASPRIAVSLTRIVESGGGKICSVNNDNDITHYAVTQDKIEMVDDQKIKSLVVKGAHVCFTDYIGSLPFLFTFFEHNSNFCLKFLLVNYDLSLAKIKHS